MPLSWYGYSVVSSPPLTQQQPKSQSLIAALSRVAHISLNLNFSEFRATALGFDWILKTSLDFHVCAIKFLFMTGFLQMHNNMKNSCFYKRHFYYEHVRFLHSLRIEIV